MGFIDFFKKIFGHKLSKKGYRSLDEEAMDMGCVSRENCITSVVKFAPIGDHRLAFINQMLRNAGRKPLKPYKAEDGSLYLGFTKDFEGYCPYRAQIEGRCVCQYSVRIQQYLDRVDGIKEKKSE